MALKSSFAWLEVLLRVSWLLARTKKDAGVCYGGLSQVQVEGTYFESMHRGIRGRARQCRDWLVKAWRCCESCPAWSFLSTTQSYIQYLHHDEHLRAPSSC
jgi:hypothetical protein